MGMVRLAVLCDASGLNCKCCWTSCTRTIEQVEESVAFTGRCAGKENIDNAYVRDRGLRQVVALQQLLLTKSAHFADFAC